MNRAGKVFRLTLLLGAACCWGLVSFLQGTLNRERAALGLTRVAPLENAPPMLAFTTIALGSFRGLIANALWIRASDLQMEEKYFEMVQLADWITKLQPHFAQVWVVQAWNMSYNISVKFSDPNDRWRWVQRGLSLLRDEGLTYNPKEALLYRELAWHFQHKIGQNLDDAHMLYKTRWAKEMSAVFGSAHPNFDELIRPQTDDQRQRAQTLRERYKMDPTVMKQIEERWGPLEWRLPEAHAIYWATVGLEKSTRPDLLQLRRVIYQSLQQAVFRGRIVLERADGYLFGPDLSKIEEAYNGFEQMMAEEKEKPEAIKPGQRNFLREVVYLCYVHGRTSEAQRWFRVLKEKFPEHTPDKSMDEFALRRAAENMGALNQDRTRALLQGLLTQHYFYLSIDEDDHANGLLRMAQVIWKYYDDKVGDQRARIGLPTLAEMAAEIRNEILKPENQFLNTQQMARLRTKLNLPAAPPASSTGTPPEPAPGAGLPPR